MRCEEAACLAWVTSLPRVPTPPSTTQHPASSIQHPITWHRERSIEGCMPCHAYHNIYMLYIRTYTYVHTYILGWSRQSGQKRYAGKMRIRSRYWEGAVVNLINLLDSPWTSPWTCQRIHSVFLLLHTVFLLHCVDCECECECECADKRQGA